MHLAGLTRALAACAIAVLISCNQRVPVPDRIYRIGTDNAFPYHFTRPDGQVEGLTADLISEAARRVGVRLQWQVEMAGPWDSLKAKRVDLWSLLAVQPTIWPEVHFTRPYLTNGFTVLSTHASITAPDGLLRIRRLAVFHLPFVRRLAQQTMPWADVVAFTDRWKGFEAVCRGEADALFIEARAAHGFVLRRPAGCVNRPLHAIGAPVAPQKLGIASTLESAAVADLLREEIDRMLADGTTARLLNRWSYFYSGEAEILFREAEAYHAQRRGMLMVVLLGICCSLLFVLAIRFRSAQRAALVASRAKSTFVANMSHEMRTPLHGILGISRILSSTKLDADQREHVEMIEGSGRTLLALVNDVLDVARVERGQLSLVEERVALPELLSETVRPFELDGSGKGVQVRMHGLERLPAFVHADGGRLRQVLTNLIGNAVKFTQAGSVSISLDFYESGDRTWFRFSICDTGIGMTADQVAHVFEKFYQADARRFPGSGLGLPITKSLVEAMGGEIEVASQYGRGSTFTVHIPLRISEEPKPQSAPLADPPSASATETVLVVEDNVVNQRIVQRLLEREGYRVVTAGDGEAALRMFHPDTFDAVLMDCQLPGIDGYEVTQQIRLREAGGSHTPIIALTASAMAGERERCLNSGMDDYLTKPVDVEDLHAKLLRWIGPKTGRSPKVAPSKA